MTVSCRHCRIARWSRRACTQTWGPVKGSPQRQSLWRSSPQRPRLVCSTWQVRPMLLGQLRHQQSTPERSLPCCLAVSQQPPGNS